MWRSVVVGLNGNLLVLVDEMGSHILLAPKLRVGQVMAMDNLSAHKCEEVRKMIEDKGCDLLCLSPYLPDLNHTGEAFSKVRRLLRVIGVQKKEALVEAIGKGLDVVVNGTQEASSLTVVAAGWSNNYKRRCNVQREGPIPADSRAGTSLPCRL